LIGYNNSRCSGQHRPRGRAGGRACTSARSKRLDHARWCGPARSGPIPPLRPPPGPSAVLHPSPRSPSRCPHRSHPCFRPLSRVSPSSFAAHLKPAPNHSRLPSRIAGFLRSEVGVVLAPKAVTCSPPPGQRIPSRARPAAPAASPTTPRSHRGAHRRRRNGATRGAACRTASAWSSAA